MLEKYAKPNQKVEVVRYNREFVITVIVITGFDCNLTLPNVARNLQLNLRTYEPYLTKLINSNSIFILTECSTPGPLYLKWLFRERQPVPTCFDLIYGGLLFL